MSKFTHALTTAAIAAIGLAGNTAFAQEATYDYPQAATSQVTRAQVQAELAQARRDGSMRVWSTSYNHMTAAKSLKTRADVQADVLAASHAAMTAMIGEDSGSFALSRQPVRSAGPLLAAR